MDAAGAVAVNALQTRQDLAIASLKQSLNTDRQAAQLVADIAGGGAAASAPAGGAQPLNASGRGQIVNLLV